MSKAKRAQKQEKKAAKAISQGKTQKAAKLQKKANTSKAKAVKKADKKDTKKAQPKKHIIKKAAKNVAKKVSNSKPIKALKKVVSKVDDAAKFLVLAPFVPAMRLSLKKKHIPIPHGAKNKEIASLFYVNVIKKHHLEHCEHLDNYTSGNMAFGQAAKLFSVGHRENLVEEASEGIIKAILDFFSGKSKQKNAEEEVAEGGEVSPENELTEEEKEVVNTEEPITEEEVEVIEESEKAQDELAEEIGGEDSEGNIHVNEEEFQEELERLQSLESNRDFGVMKFINRY